jgi:hypothetical protein
MEERRINGAAHDVHESGRAKAERSLADRTIERE